MATHKGKHSREYMREYMSAYRAAGRDKTVAKKKELPFVGFDGEGGNLESGYHAYFLLSVGESSLVPSAGNARLTTAQCLEFITQLPRNAVYVVYFGDYDFTKILEDLGWSKLERLMDRSKRTRKDGKGTFPVSYGPYDLDYLPRKEFKVRKAGGPWTVINDVGSFFQCRFVEALEKWGIGTAEERDLIGAGKEARGSFQFMDIEEITRYNQLEIKLLAELMEKFREACKKVGVVPAKWQGPGLLAEALFAKHGVKRTRDIPLFSEPGYAGLLEFGRNAFYGGRPEIAVVGPVDRVTDQWDINSAYPYAMQFLPCLEHGEWTREVPKTPYRLTTDRTEYAISFGSFYAEPSNGKRYPIMYGLPTRTKQGTIVYPANGRGWYWNFEIQSAKHQRFMVEESWVYHRDCDCEPMGFVRDVYEQRLEMGKDDAGIILKLALNSMYGKRVQSIGSPKYADPISGSFITAYCRKMIQDFIHSSELCTHPDGWCGKDILMIATDSVCTFTERNDIEPSKALGGWSRETHTRGMFIVQPGLYFGSSGKPSKTRGVPRSVISEKEREFRDAFDRMVKSRDLSYGDIDVPQRLFVGIRYALHRHNLKLLGQWIEFVDPETGRTGKTIRFDWSSKRAKYPVIDPVPGIHSYIETFPQDGDPELCTLPYSKDIGAVQLRESLRVFFDGQPDFISQIEPTQLGVEL